MNIDSESEDNSGGDYCLLVGIPAAKQDNGIERLFARSSIYSSGPLSSIYYCTVRHKNSSTIFPKDKC